MTPQKPPQFAPADDIDLINLLERIYLFFRRFRKVFIIAIIAGVLLGCIGYFSARKVYQSRIILHSSYLTNQEEIEIIDYWDQLVKKNESKLLASMLHCSQDVVNKVVSLDAAEIQKDYSSSNPNGYYIDAKVTDNSILPGLQNAIVDGLNNSEFVKQKLTARKQSLNELIAKLSLEANKLDSVKKDIEDIVSNKQKNSFPLVLDVSGLNNELIEMNEKLVNYKNELKFISSAQVLQGFIPMNTPVSRSLKVTIVVGLIFTLAVAYVYSLIKYVEERLKKRVKANA